MLSQVPTRAVVPASGQTLSVLTAVGVTLQVAAPGLELVWNIAPSAQFVKEATGAQRTGAQVVQEYLTELLATSLTRLPR